MAEMDGYGDAYECYDARSWLWELGYIRSCLVRIGIPGWEGQDTRRSKCHYSELRSMISRSEVEDPQSPPDAYIMCAFGDIQLFDIVASGNPKQEVR